MIEDYAVEPDCFRSPDALRYLFEKFGFHHGRFIVAYPSGWLSKIRNELSSLPDGQRKRAIEYLAKYRDDRIVERKIDFDPTRDWANNAAIAKQHREIDKAICGKSNAHGITTYDEIDESFFLPAESGRTVANVKNYSSAIQRLLQISREVILVDPYFQFSRPGRTKVLSAFLSEAMRTPCKSFVLFCRHSIATNAGGDKFRQLAQQFCSRHLFHDQKLTVNLLDDEGRPNAMHARYIFSRKGGIAFDKGFQEEPVETYVDLALIAPKLLDDLCKLYLDGNHGHTVVASYTWKGSNS